MSTQFQGYCHDHGIINETSFAHSPNQNGVSERKYRHIPKIARCLLLKLSIHNYYWPEAQLTVCYLLNKMPSSVLQNQIPYSTLRPNNSLYFIQPKVFDCICFIHLHIGQKDKLSTISVKCIFLVYSRT